MNQQLNDYSQAVSQYIENLPKDGGDWLVAQRSSAAERFTEIGFPNAKIEAWKYTGIEGLLKQGFETTDKLPEFPEHAVLRQFLEEPVAGRLVFVDGVYQADLSTCDTAGITVGNLRSAMAASDRAVLEVIGSLSGMGDHGFAALNLATVHDGAVIRVTSETCLEQPIELLHVATKSAEGQALRSRHLIMLETGASANLIERYVALDDAAYFNNLVCEISLAAGAKLTHQRVQLESPRAYHLSDIHLGLQADAYYHGINAAVGAAWSRTLIHNRFTAQGANCELDGLYLAGDGQLTDFHLDVDHAVPHCDSRENFRGILHGAGKAVFDGLIQVREQAQKSNAHLYNANLMLSRHAEIDTKPQLVILADDVQCSHGTTVGQLDPQAVFYLRSRGLDEQRARHLLSLGFASEVIDRFENETLRLQLADVIRQQLQS
ncbi:MAG: Fe-S cluster assembly protein SufD [Candidatus Thiodiazotropha sp. (ex Myrtea sp. 'scaly one' KF741663)]|nr:Fe-S cluster assembly protein SufD [Candidatus Thiodiazotropha sp. (ex Myrtea sp. 'scaly one' KF741663)]